jgi:hypothetical protein
MARAKNFDDRTSEEDEFGHYTEESLKAAARAVRRHNPAATDLHVYKTVPFLLGKLHLIEFKEGGRRDERGVYLHGERAVVFREIEQIADFISDNRPHWWDRVVDAQTVTAVLAIAILGALLTLQFQIGVRELKDINPIFTNALTLVLGFYFGQRRLS